LTNLCADDSGNGEFPRDRAHAKECGQSHRPPAVAAGIELERWDLERVVEITADYARRKEDAKFEQAFAELA